MGLGKTGVEVAHRECLDSSFRSETAEDEEEEGRRGRQTDNEVGPQTSQRLGGYSHRGYRGRRTMYRIYFHETQKESLERGTVKNVTVSQEG